MRLRCFDATLHFGGYLTRICIQGLWMTPSNLPKIRSTLRQGYKKGFQSRHIVWSMICMHQTNVVSLLDAFCDQHATIVLASFHKAGSRAKEVLAGTWVFNSCECQCTSPLYGLSAKQITPGVLQTLSPNVYLPLSSVWKVKGLLSFCAPCHILPPTHFDQDAKFAFDAPKWEQELGECIALLLLP